MKHQGLGLLLDERSKRNPLGQVIATNGGWENYKYSSGGDGDEILKNVKVPVFDGPILPQTIKAPKNCLSVWYGRRHKDFIFCANDCFVSWHCGPDHERYFTCIFTCPSSGEKFMCGTYHDARDIKITQEKVKDGDDTVTVVWYRRKKDAENAAAARALDCFSYREGRGEKRMSYGLCLEPPYLEEEYLIQIPAGAPDQAYDEVMTRPCHSKETKDIVMDEDTEHFRKEYRLLRGSNNVENA